MPAPNIATLFDFETNYENPLASYFVNAAPFANANVDVITSLTPIANTEYLTTPRLTVEVVVTGTDINHEQQIPNSAVRFYDHKMLGITLTLTTARDDPAQNHGLLRGAIRAAMLETSAIMNSNSVPYYQTVYVTETGSTQGQTESNDEISTAISYALNFAILPSAWPNA